MNRIVKIFLVFLFYFCSHTYSMIYYGDSISSESQLLLLDSVITTYQVQYCCQSTIAKCIEKRVDCPFAHRFYNFVCWMVMNENTFEKINQQLSKRYVSFFDTTSFTLAETGLQLAGDKNSPITITVYMSANCSLCKKVCIPLFMAVTDGPLQKKATLKLKPVLPNISNRALYAANKMGKLWEFYGSLEKEKRRLDEKILISKAKKIGLSEKEFKKWLHDPSFLDILKASKTEALNNDMSVTPTLFINSRRYSSYKDPQWIVDIVEYEYEKVK